MLKFKQKIGYLPLWIAMALIPALDRAIGRGYSKNLGTGCAAGNFN